MGKSIKSIISSNDFILMEAAIVEILRRGNVVSLHPSLIHAHLIYDTCGKQELYKIYNSYIQVAKDKNVPLLICTPTWRSNQENVLNANISHSINEDAVQYLIELREQIDLGDLEVLIGGTIGPKNDCYRPELGLSVKDAELFHKWQINQLCNAKADFIIAETLPSVEEALGIAFACSQSSTDYIISFVISKDGKVIDGTPLSEAIDRIDESVTRKPLGYFINCAFPTFLCADHQPKELFKRLIGFQGNASSLDHCELDNADMLHQEDISIWGVEMLKLKNEYGVKILGGCCGTNEKHLKYIVDNL